MVRDFTEGGTKNYSIRMFAPSSPGIFKLGPCRYAVIWKSETSRSVRFPRTSLAGNICRAQTQSNASAVHDLLTAIRGTERGVSTTGAQRQAILTATAALTELGRGSTTTCDTLSATWKLLWTTEKVAYQDNLLQLH